VTSALPKNQSQSKCRRDLCNRFTKTLTRRWPMTQSIKTDHTSIYTSEPPKRSLSKTIWDLFRRQELSRSSSQRPSPRSHRTDTFPPASDQKTAQRTRISQGSLHHLLTLTKRIQTI
jgi:hypothetical protein